jgi:hypothetical protein
MSQRKRPQQLVATEGASLNTLHVVNVLNIKIPTVNEDGVGSSPTAPAIGIVWTAKIRQGSIFQVIDAGMSQLRISPITQIVVTL